MKPQPRIEALLAIAFVGLFCCLSCSDNREHSAGAISPPLTIQPRAAVGPVKAGMAVQEVISLLGEPDRRTANALEYTRLGFAVMPGPDGAVQIVMCGDVTGLGGPLVKAFTGRTREGIGLTSTREEILKTYGQPDVDEKLRGGTESLRYDALGITFTLEAGKVYHMIVRLNAAQPDRSVSLEPVTIPTAQ